jgi:magnesium-transporting ATPase (P-type)
MSVVVKDLQKNEILLLSKGADSIMEKLMVQGDKDHDRRMNITKTYLDAYANVGLRTLILTKKVISKSEYDRWSKEYNDASNSLTMREEKLDAVNAKIEVDMTLVGSTAIEDRLQDEVSETIISMKEAGIKLWVLTGDKIETAVNIGYSCGLLNNEMSQYYIDAVDIGPISHQMADVVDQIHNMSIDDE